MLAISLPRPWPWLVARDLVASVVLPVDASLLVGSLVLLHSGAKGDHAGYKQLRHILRGTPFEGYTVEDLQAECPHGAVVGVARVVHATRRADGWVAHFVEARPLPTTTLPAQGDGQVWQVPPHVLARLGFRNRRAA